MKRRLPILLALLMAVGVFNGCMAKTRDVKDSFLFELLATNKNGRYDALAAALPGADGNIPPEEDVRRAWEGYYAPFEPLTDDKMYGVFMANAWLYSIDKAAWEMGISLEPKFVEYETISDNGPVYSHYAATVAATVAGEQREIVIKGQIAVDEIDGQEKITAFRFDDDKAFVNLIRELTPQAEPQS